PRTGATPPRGPRALSSWIRSLRRGRRCRAVFRLRARLARQLGELVQRERLTPAPRVDARRAAQPLGFGLADPEGVLERVRELLAPHLERAAYDAEQQRLAWDLDRRPLPQEEAHQHGVHPGPWPEGPGAHRHERLEERVVAREQRERAVGWRAGRG